MITEYVLCVVALTAAACLAKQTWVMSYHLKKTADLWAESGKGTWKGSVKCDVCGWHASGEFEGAEPDFPDECPNCGCNAVEPAEVEDDE